jgi:hypothetical protein
MAMIMNEADNTSRRPARRNSSKSIVPPPSAEATARKLDLPVEDAQNETEFEETSKTTMKQSNRKAQTNREAEIQYQERQQTIARLTEKRDEYVERLDIGAAKIEEARSQGKDVTSWEDYWIQLLRQYEAVCDKLRDLTNQG